MAAEFDDGFDCFGQLESIYEWDIDKLKVIQQFIENNYESGSEEKEKVLSHLYLLQAVCTGDSVPVEVIENNVDWAVQFDKLSDKVNFKSPLIKDNHCWLSLGHALLSHYTKYQNADTIFTLSNVVDLLLSSSSSSKCCNPSIKKFIFETWNVFLYVRHYVPINTMELIVRNNQYTIEESVIKTATKFVTDESSTAINNLQQLSKFCSQSSYIFQTTTSILNEIISIKPTYAMLQFVQNFIVSVKEHCSTSDTDIVDLYPNEWQVLTGLLAFDPELLARHYPLQVSEITEMINEEISENIEKDSKPLLAVLTHFSAWLPYIKSEYVENMKTTLLLT